MTQKQAESHLEVYVMPESLTAMKWMFRSVWDEIGGDCISLNEGRDMTGKEVQEMVADADRYKQFDQHRKAAEAFDALPRDVQDAVLELTFPSKNKYGY